MVGYSLNHHSQHKMIPLHLESLLTLKYFWGSGCSTVVEHMPRDREIMGSNTVGYWAFFSSLISPIWIVSWRRNSSEFPIKNILLISAAWGKASLLGTVWEKISGITFNRNNRRWISSGSNDSTIRLWDADTGSFQGSFNRHEFAVLDLVTLKTFTYLSTFV